MNRPLPPAMTPRRQFSPLLLAARGLVLMGIDVFFALARLAFLSEDARYIGMSSPRIHDAVPGLARWLDKVFWVMGGFVFTSGPLVVYLARTSFRTRERGPWGAAALAGVTSIGMLTAVNLVLASDFRWPLLAVAMLWTTALAPSARDY